MTDQQLEVVSVFCQYTERSLRCVSAKNHIGKHDLQPQSSVSARAILRQETVDTRLAGVRKPVTGEKLLEELDKAVKGGQPSPLTPLLTEVPPSQTTPSESVPAPGDSASRT